MRQEDFGLLFYDTRSTRLTFVRSGDRLVPPPFTGARRELRFAPRRRRPAGRRGAADAARSPRLLDGLVAKGLLVVGPGSDTVAQRLSTTPLRAPVNVTWEITEACNLDCAHCLSAELRAERRGELDFEQCRALLDELARMQVFQINFGGGEPFLRDDFLDILRYAHGLGITTCVSTNGTVLDDALVDALLEIGAEHPAAPVYLQVSLDGAQAGDQRRHPRRAARSSGSLAGIELLARRRYPDFSLNMVVTRLNAGEVGDFDRLARSYGAKTRLSRFRPSGGGCHTWDDYRLTREQLAELSAFLGDHPEILTGDSFFSLTPDSRRNLGLNMCGAAKMTCAVAPDGSVYPCAFLADPAFLSGNVDGGAALGHLPDVAGVRALPRPRGGSLPRLRPLLDLPRRMSRCGILSYGIDGPSRPGVSARGGARPGERGRSLRRAPRAKPRRESRRSSRPCSSPTCSALCR